MTIKEAVETYNRLNAEIKLMNGLECRLYAAWDGCLPSMTKDLTFNKEELKALIGLVRADARACSEELDDKFKEEA